MRDRGVRLDRESVQRNVGRRQFERALDVASPIALEVRGQGEDQIERDVIDAAAVNRLDGLRDLSRVVRAVHPIQNGVIEALRAE